MIRADIISTIGREFLTSNIENDEYSYPKAYKVANLDFTPILDKKGRKFEKLDIRFVKDGITVLVETKTDFSKDIQHQETEDLISNQISMVEYYDPFKKWLESNRNK